MFGRDGKLPTVYKFQFSFRKSFGTVLAARPTLLPPFSLILVQAMWSNFIQEDTLEFDKYLHTSWKDYMPSTSRHVHNKLEENDLGMVISSTPSSTVDSESEDRTMGVRKHQGHCWHSYAVCYPF